MRVVVLTSDKYLASVRPFAHLFNRYWSPLQPVTVAGFTPPTFALPENFHFHTIGAFADYPVTRWSDALLALLDQIDDAVVTLMLEDYWLTRPVNVEAVAMLDAYAQQFGYVARIDLTTDRLYAAGATDYGRCGYLDLIRSDPASAYHMSMMAGVWRVEHLRRVLIPGETPWQVEIMGTQRLAQLHDVLVLGTRQYPVRYILAHRGGDPGTVSFGEPGICLGARLADDDIADLRARGWV